MPCSLFLLKYLMSKNFFVSLYFETNNIYI